MTSQRLDVALAKLGLADTRSQAENLIRLGDVMVDGKVVTKTGFMVDTDNLISIKKRQRYVSRAGLKLASVARLLQLDFNEKTVLDVGSSTGGFTDYALKNGAKKVIAVDVGTDQMHPSLVADSRVELHEKTDIRNFTTDRTIDIVVIDVSFVSLRQILPSVFRLSSPSTLIVAMVKPQFETSSRDQLTRNGIIKNKRIRKDILFDFEQWVKSKANILGKKDSEIAGSHGNLERFYLLKKIAKIL